MGYVQFVMLTILFYPVWDLIKLGVYPDPRSTNREEAKSKCLSRDQMDWSDDYRFHISEADARMLAREVTLPSIEFVLQCMTDGTLPTLDEAKEFITTSGNFVFETEIPHGATSRRKVNGEDADLAETVELEESAVGNVNELDEDHVEDREARRGTIYDINNCTMDVPWPVDLNTISTCMGTVDCYRHLVNQCLENILVVM